jgi:hypothetical protein
MTNIYKIMTFPEHHEISRRLCTSELPFIDFGIQTGDISLLCMPPGFGDAPHLSFQPIFRLQYSVEEVFH